MSNTLSDLSTAMADVVVTAGPSIVRVEARRRLPATGIVWSNDGLIITAHHVVHQDENIKIGLADGSVVPAVLVGRDLTTDIAILRAEASGLAPLTESTKEDRATGHFALALGRPGLTVQAAFGILSAVGGSWRTHHGGLIDQYLQADLTMYPGFSGGALVNANGRLLGLNTSALSRNRSIAVPPMTLARVAESLLTHGRIKRAYLGAQTQRVKLPKAMQEELGQEYGLLIISVGVDSPAEKSGLTMGDTLVTFVDLPISSSDSLMAQLTSDRIGQKNPTRILRSGKLEMISLVLGEQP